jgi:alpha-galactosidase
MKLEQVSNNVLARRRLVTPCRSVLVMTAVLGALAGTALALDNGFTTPPLGWSSWNHFGRNIDGATLREIADAMAANGLAAAGYRYVNLDDGWALNRTSEGELFADPVKFPPSVKGANDGVKLVADYVHSKGLLFGIYTARGSRTCVGRPGSDSHEAQDAATWAAWGVE